jgi:dienelactone hydrolase
MTDLAEPLPSAASTAPEAHKAAPTLPPLLLALGRGFTLVGWAAIVLVNGIYGLSEGWGLGPVLDFLVMALAGFLFVFLFDGLFSLLWKLLNVVLPRVRLGGLNEAVQAVPAAMLGRLVGILLMVFGDLLWPESVFQYATLALPAKFLVMASAIAGALIFAARLYKRPATRYALVALGALPVVAVAAWLIWPGVDDYVVKAAPANGAISTLAIANPGLPGPFAVNTLSYGSGADRRRAEYAEDAAIITPAVDGSTLISAYSGFPGAYYRWYNGFDFADLPLNGLVWYPEGDGPFPLVLIVHGNHGMMEPSDPGYAYLGQHLASHGLIAVSVDENFLNGFNLADPDMAEMPLRAWLLLKHLELWRDWNSDPGNPLYGRVDLDRVGLIGHSRGGEAVAHAAEMNVRPVGRIGTVSDAEDFGFGIRGVIALAPCDHRYKPAGRALQLKNADYLLLATGHDGDMYYLDGLGQYARTNFDENPAGFKAMAYLYRGNHGNFNTVWGNADKGWFNSTLLNRAPLLSAEEQQQAAKVYITGFLEASLNEHEEYRALFYDPAATRSWLPDDVIVTQYLDADFIAVDTNERGKKTDLDLPGGQAEARDMTDWQIAGRTLRDGETDVPNRGLRLEWAAGGDPAYIIHLPEGASEEWRLSPAHALSFTIGNMMAAGTPGRIWVEVESVGEVARLPLDQFGPLQPPLPATLTKAGWIAAMPGYEIDTATPFERVDQTYDLPLSAFGAANPDFQPGALSVVRFFFDGKVDGAIMLDDVGFRAPLTAAPEAQLD